MATKTAIPNILRGKASTVTAQTVLPAATIPVASVSGVATTGGVAVVFSQVAGKSDLQPQLIAFTGVSGSTLTGCTGGTGTIPVGQGISMSVALPGAGGTDTPDGTSLGIPMPTGDAQTGTLWLAYTSRDNAGAAECTVWGSAFGVVPASTALLQATWGPVCVVNVAAAAALSTSGGGPVEVGYSVPVKPTILQLPAVPSGTTAIFGIPIDVRDVPYLALICAEYGQTGTPGNLLAFLTMQA